MERCTTGSVGQAVVFELGALGQRLASLPDPSKRRGKRYPLPLLLVLAKLAGEDRPSGIADWVAHRAAALQAALGVRWRRMPQHNTYRRLLGTVVDPDALDGVPR